MRLILALVVCLSVTSCATSIGAISGAMVPALQEDTIIDSNSPLFGAVSVGEVTGGQETNPYTGPNVSNEALKEALVRTLSTHAMYVGGEGKYLVDVELLSLQVPSFGLSFKVTSEVRYTLIQIETPQTIFQETVIEDYTVSSKEVRVATERARIAIEGSIRTSLSKLTKIMIARVN